MLSCKDVRKHLAAIEAGEPAPGELRDHLASCDACRAEAAAVRADLETLRSGLAALAPSPFLEDAALEAARGESQAPPRGRARWLPAGIGVAAAAVILAFVFLAKLPSGAEQGAGAGPGEDPGGPSLVEMPPTAAQAAVERKARLAKTRIMTELRFGMIGAPPPGMAVVGRMLLNRIGPKREGYAGAKIAFDRLTKNGRQQEIVVTVGAPGWRGATARIRARVVLEYTGNLILEETLARALGLHAFEVPGGVTVGGDYGMAGEQARASIRIGDKDLETNVEVLHEHVPLPAVPLQSGGVPQAMRIVIRGARPDSGYAGRRITLVRDPVDGLGFDIHDAAWTQRKTGKGAFELGILKQGPLQSVLSYEAGNQPRCIVFLPSLDIGGGGPLAWAVRTERVTLQQKFTPGAEVTIARVWRGRTAIPSRESVAHTSAAEDGHVSFVHVRGERGPLRAREVRKDGTVAWHDLAVYPDGPAGKDTLVAHVAADGSVRIGTEVMAVWGRTASGDVKAPDAAAEKRLRAALKTAADAAGRDAQKASELKLRIRADANTPWRMIERLLRNGAHPDVRIWRIEFARADGSGPFLNELPRDQGLQAIRVKRVNTSVRILRDGGSYRWRTGGHAAALEGPVDGSKEGLPKLETTLRAAKAAVPVDQEVTSAMKPIAAIHGVLPYDVVYRVLRRMQSSGVDMVHIESAPPRRP